MESGVDSSINTPRYAISLLLGNTRQALTWSGLLTDYVPGSPICLLAVIRNHLSAVVEARHQRLREP